jgi:hypothetical protein
VTGFLRWFPASLLTGGSLLAQDRIAISEIMYHPVEEAAFAANGEPLLDLSHDVHEYIELHNYSMSTSCRPCATVWGATTCSSRIAA